jgi:hypothetical protein
MTEKGVPGSDIKVETNKGVVSLSSDDGDYRCAETDGCRHRQENQRRPGRLG